MPRSDNTVAKADRDASGIGHGTGHVNTIRHRSRTPCRRSRASIRHATSNGATGHSYGHAPIATHTVYGDPVDGAIVVAVVVAGSTYYLRPSVYPSVYPSSISRLSSRPSERFRTRVSSRVRG